MSAARFRGVPVFWSTLLLLVASLVVAQVVGFLLLLVAPPPRPDFNRMSDVVAGLSGRPVRDVHEAEERERALVVHRAAAAPGPRPGMVSDAGFVEALAGRLGVAPARVRLFFEPDRAGSPFERRRHRRGPVAIHDGEPLFFTPVVAALETPGRGWQVAETGPPPLVAPWQRRMILWFAASVVVLLPLVWAFARAITRPIRRFADAADRLGADPRAPGLAEEGPAELRVTAHALNRMQGRLGEYVAERTAMIGAIAHDLRTPLARIAFRIEAAPEPLREKVMGDVEQMRAMLAATIGFVRATDAGGERVPVDLADLLGAIVAQERETGRAVALAAHAPAPVVGDPLALARLFQNLVDNGVTYGERVEVAVAARGEAAEVRVIDHGPGMPPELLARAFQPFVRGEPSRNRATGGIGLGLTIARTISEDHGGTLTLANRPDGGLEARCRLPLAA